MILSLILIILGFIFLIKGADLLVDGSSNIAKKFHIPEIVIGLTIVSIGTSMPELFISITSAINGYSDMAIGNVIGSSISNLLLILGISTIIKPIKFKRETRLIEIPLCLCVSIIFIVICNIGQNVTRIDGIILIFMFIFFILYTIIMSFKGEKFDKEDYINVEEQKNTNKGSALRNIAFIVLGLVALKIGGDLTVDNSVNIAKTLGLSEKIISITILAIGTSLPELVTSVSASIKGESDIAIGNILGSNIFNVLLVIGTSSLINPITYNAIYNKDMIILLVSTSLLILFSILPQNNEMNRTNGVIYCILYMVYMTSLFYI